LLQLQIFVFFSQVQIFEFFFDLQQPQVEFPEFTPPIFKFLLYLSFCSVVKKCHLSAKTRPAATSSSSSSSCDSRPATLCRLVDEIDLRLLQVTSRQTL